MTEPSSEREAKALWQSQPTPAAAPPLAEIKRRARWSVRIIVLRNSIDYLAYVSVTVWLLYTLVFLDQGLAFRVATVTGLIVSAFGCYLIWKNASVMRPPSEAGARDYLEFQRAQLTRQLSAVRSSWRWYIAPIIVMMMAFCIAAVITYPALRGLVAALIIGGTTIAACALTLLVNAVRAIRLKRMLRALDHLDPTE